MANANSDAIAAKISAILRHLLAFEADAAHGRRYTTVHFTSGESERKSGGKISDDGNELCIHIPSFGTLRLKRDSFSTMIQSSQILAPEKSTSETPRFDERLEGSLPNGALPWFDAEDSLLQGVDTNLFDSFIQASELEEDECETACSSMKDVLSGLLP